MDGGMSEPLVSVWFKEDVTVPGSREYVKRAVASDKLTLTRDSTGVTATSTNGEHHWYPNASIRQATNLPLSDGKPSHYLGAKAKPTAAA